MLYNVFLKNNKNWCQEQKFLSENELKRFVLRNHNKAVLIKAINLETKTFFYSKAN